MGTAPTSPLHHRCSSEYRAECTAQHVPLTYLRWVAWQARGGVGVLQGHREQATSNGAEQRIHFPHLYVAFLCCVHVCPSNHRLMHSVVDFADEKLLLYVRSSLSTARRDSSHVLTRRSVWIASQAGTCSHTPEPEVGVGLGVSKLKSSTDHQKRQISTTERDLREHTSNTHRSGPPAPPARLCSAATQQPRASVDLLHHCWRCELWLCAKSSASPAPCFAMTATAPCDSGRSRTSSCCPAEVLSSQTSA